ncbi:hypothetical protein GCM10027416_30370 [Okibacterium endophyticum]
MSARNYPDDGRNVDDMPYDANDRRDVAHDGDTRARAAAVPADDQPSLREDVVEREQSRFGGVKVGSAFFGWLAATGTAVLLAGLIAAIGVTALGGDLEEASDQAMSDVMGSVLVGSIVVIVVLFVAYFCGGYVAGRMARFNGAIQGLAVWLWALVIGIVLAIVGAIVGDQFNVLANVNAFPSIQFDDFSTAGVVTAVLALIASLGGAVLGGMAGMRFHRRVDRAGLGR